MDLPRARQKAFLLVESAWSPDDPQKTSPALPPRAAWLSLLWLHAGDSAVLSSKEVVQHRALEPSSTGFIYAVIKVPRVENQPPGLCIPCNWAAKLQPSKATLLHLPVG